MLRPELTPEEQEAKQALRKQLQYGNLALILFFMRPPVTTAINNEHPNYGTTTPSARRCGRRGGYGSALRGGQHEEDQGSLHGAPQGCGPGEHARPAGEREKREREKKACALAWEGKGGEGVCVLRGKRQ